MPDMNRREFVTAVACAACLCGLGGSVLADDAPTTQPGPIDVGAKSDYAADGITAKYMAFPDRIAVIRHEGKIYACSTVCTHKGGTLRLSAPGSEVMKCPRHGALFDIDGDVTKGPAKNPLPRYAISEDANGHLIVDKSRKFDQDHWDDPASFVKV